MTSFVNIPFDPSMSYVHLHPDEDMIQAELEALLEQVEAEEQEAKKTLTFTPELTNPSLALLEERFANRARAAEEIEAQIYSDIYSYEWPCMGIHAKAVVDFMKLEFVPQTNTHRSMIKKYLTEKTGTKFYIEELEVDTEQLGNKFVITIHDVKNRRQLEQILDELSHYGLNRQLVKVVEIELSLDFYNAPRKELLIALLKSLRLPEDAQNIRVYREKGTRKDVPIDLMDMQTYIHESYCIGVNPKGEDLYYRLYHKVTDRQQPLPPDQHRLRLEVNLGRSKIEKFTPYLADFKTIINEGFKYIDFTELDADADASLKDTYRKKVKPYGQEIQPFRSRSGNKRTLQEGIKLNATLNRLKRNAVSNLVRNFA
ncbi:hypothetical protein R4483_18000 [Acinetobacter baumannii]|nr:hypothetical protein [Acinetobacter baumannii]